MTQTCTPVPKSAQALLTKGKKIVDSVTTEEILSVSLQKTIGLQGHIVLPGFNGSHLHLLNLGKSLHQLSLPGIRSIEELRAA